MRVIEALREHSWKRAGRHPRRRAGYRHFPHGSRWTRQLHQGLSPIIGAQDPIVEKATRLICTRCNLVLEVIFWSNDFTSWNCFNDSEDYIGADINSQHFLGSNYIITDIYGEQICINCRIRAIKQALG